MNEVKTAVQEALKIGYRHVGTYLSSLSIICSIITIYSKDLYSISIDLYKHIHIFSVPSVLRGYRSIQLDPFFIDVLIVFDHQ